MKQQQQPLSDAAIAEQAAQWVARLTADDPAEQARARAGFASWQAADARHARAGAALQALLGQLAQTPPAAAGRCLQAGALAARAAGRSRRQHAGATALALALLLALPSWLALQAWPAAWLLADLRTGHGQWSEQRLADGSLLRLNGGSAVSLHFDDQRRVIELAQGELLIDVASDPQRPLLVRTPQGEIRALGTRFVVSRQGAEATELSMLESRTAVRASGTTSEQVVMAGQALRIEAGRSCTLTPIDAAAVEAAWQGRQLVVNERPLAEVLDTLARHRPGLLRYDRAAIEGLRVSAVLPLDQPEQALRLLVTSFPQLRMRSTLAGWVMWVDVGELP
ncbi:transmembrane sensor [Paucibacter oligotrophus]|uniref:Transmembrane sensor n=1 Tax=Roseateles oligotrophus TaxID=1769250 RepID=A0A840LCP4_9BURK|nr:FecR domain-containing protein [Roseateles oligotrophus]MBB4845930.1 transmembrane sensor [Roseateles oligotrophus]